MPTPPPRLSFLEKLNVDYLKSQIETGDPNRTKKALQDLCKLYRGGLRIRPAELVGMENSIVGLLYTQKDEKARRWALNSLARLGREATCMEAILHTLRNYGDDPQTAAAAIAAVYRMSLKASEILKTLSFDGQMIALAALQHVDAKMLDLSALPLNVSTASPEHLKLALLVVGLDRAPVNLLNPRHDNAQMVKALGTHHDIIVSQYSVWAITENPFLGVGDLGVDIRDVEQQKPNVRAWIFQLLAMTPEDAQSHFEYIQLGMRDPEPESRLGLARGLAHTYFDGLEVLVLDWFTTEHDGEVSQHLLDHLVKHSQHCANYEKIAIEVFEKEPTGSQLSQRMEVNAAGTPLYAKFRRLQLDGSSDLFRGGTTVNNKTTYNISGGIQGGAVSIGGDAENRGSTSVHYGAQTIETIQSELSKAEKELHTLAIEAELKKETLEHVQAAKADPTPDKIAKAIATLSKIENLATKVLGAGTAIAGIIVTLGKAAGLL